MSPWLLIIIGWAAMAVIMTGLWVLQRWLGRPSIVDVVWAVGVGALSIFFTAASDGYEPRRILIAALASIWALRLSSHLLVRIVRLPEDGRYESMRKRWGDKTQLYLFGFFQVQAFWSVLFSLPMLVAARNDVPELGMLDLLGALVWAVSIGGEWIADRQLQRFRSDPENRGKVCRDGLWRYSRHPNYFFEWIHWWAYVLIGWNAPYGWLTLFGPAVMYVFLTKITGVPPTEEQALASRGEAYREYQRTTSVFFPWPPKEKEAEVSNA